LQNRMMQNVIYKNVYVDYLCQWKQNDFSLAAMEPKIDSIADVIRPYVYADPNKQFSNANFDLNIDNDVMGNIPGIKDFITARRASLDSQLQQFGCSPVGVDEMNGENSFSIYPNPFYESTIIGNAAFKNAELSVYDLMGQEVWNSKNISFPYVFLRGNMNSGIYFYRIKKDEVNVYSGKMIAE